MSKFSINLLVYNGLKFLPQCIESVLNQSYKEYDFLIIDNNSTDGSRDYLKILQRSMPHIKIIFNETNAGFAAGHNQGIGKSDSEYILCLNQDIILDKDFLKNAVEILNRGDKIGALQPKLLRLKKIDGEWQKTDIIDTTGLMMLKNRRIVNRGQGWLDTKYQIPNTKYTEVFGADGAAPIYKREALENIKIPISNKNFEYFDEDFFMYKEDVDLAWRMRLYGWKTVYAPDIIGWHARGAGDSAKTKYLDVIKERRKISQFSKYYSFKNQRLMQIKNELPLLLLRHLFWWLPKEIASWFYILIFEHYTIKTIKKLIMQIPKMLKKRRLIMENKKITAKEMKKWFI
ncbi:MAG: hypothetical protein US76_00190 [Parcubacteria group bacterium GW2011_GWA2_38_13b]|nr:MAG: hypothetical protein US76_00190 [Parcubacteria group bacterium GW2011_GWA2_38_13b]